MRPKWVAVAATVIVVATVGIVWLTTARRSAPSPGPARAGARPGSFPLTAVAGDGVAWLTWSPPQGCPSGVFQAQRSVTGDGGPWQSAGQGGGSNSFKDLDLTDGTRLWYRVSATCGNRTEVSAQASVVPEVEPYTWDFGRRVEGTPGTSEGWTAGAIGRTTAHPQAHLGQAVATKALKPVAGGVSGPAGLLSTDAPAGNPAAMSPPGLNVPAGSYPELTIAVTTPAPTQVAVSWVHMAGRKWTTPITCPLIAGRGPDAVCDLRELGPSWKGNIGRLELAFPGAAAVHIDRVQLVGRPAGKPLVGAIRWDGWFATDSTAVDPSLYTDFDAREPSLGWFDAPGPTNIGKAAGSTPLPQHASDLVAEMQEAHDAGIDFWAFNWYPGQGAPAAGPAAPGPFGSALSDYEAYLSSAAGDRDPLLDYTLIVRAKTDVEDRQAGAQATLPYWTRVLVPELVQHFRQDSYVKVDGSRPLLYWQGLSALDTSAGFGACSSGCWHLALAELDRQTEAAGLGAPYLVDTDSDPVSAKKFGFDGLTSYGPDVTEPVTYDTQGHQGWSRGSRSPVSIDDAVADQTTLGQDGALIRVQPGVTATLDHRPKDAGTEFAALNGRSADTFWFDYPTFSQWEDHFRDMFEEAQLYPGRSSDPSVVLIYSWNETAEGGGMQPSATYGSYLLDAVKAVTAGAEPAEYWNVWDDSNVALSYQGTWTQLAPDPQTASKSSAAIGPSTPVPGAFGNDEHVDPNRGPGDTATLRLGRSVAVRVLASTGPNLGIESVDLDGRLTDVDLYSPSVKRQVIVYEQDGLTPGDHTLTIRTTGRRNRASSGTTIGIDAVMAIGIRPGMTAGASPPPEGLAARGYDSRVDISWQPDPGATGYEVERATSPAGPWQIVSRVAPSQQALSYADTRVPAGIHLWYYRVATSFGSAVVSSDVIPVVTVPDLGADGPDGAGATASGHWLEEATTAGRPQTLDELLFSTVPPSAPTTVEASRDGGRTWVTVYEARAAAGAGPGSSLGFPPVVADRIRVIVAGGVPPPTFGTYLR